ncbi:hypothetical protein ASG36_04770 [Geodermatophilus sp. Leaf369]|uniref:FliH/SctL family protein n=1 Tax=Geodermatophilus sp. Leaf369 TaxID=1736354 RepID=UPI0006FA7FED|nr:FliH/SctL family protein [Geodermatophilus sp. Leaf369]KQS60280.1 hypothetical protein ASG36_04770 [Geodermatophilus sp. Leaf369]
MLRGESTARAVAWDRSARGPGRPAVRTQQPAPPVLYPVPDGAPAGAVLRGGSDSVTAYVPDRRTTTAGRRVGDAPAPRLEEVYAAELDRLRQEAREQGWAAGHAEGTAVAADAVARAEAEAAQRAAVAQQRWEGRTASAVAALTAACAQVDATPPAGGEELHELLLRTALTLVEEVFARELAVVRRPGIDALRRALALSPADGPTVVRLHPDDLERIPAAVLDQVPDTVRVVGDDTVERAGAIAETGVRRVDAQLGPAMDRVRAVLSA